MLGDGQTRRISRFDQDDVAPVLPVFDPPRFLKRSDNSLSGNGGQCRH